MDFQEYKGNNNFRKGKDFDTIINILSSIALPSFKDNMKRKQKVYIRQIEVESKRLKEELMELRTEAIQTKADLEKVKEELEQEKQEKKELMDILKKVFTIHLEDVQGNSSKKRKLHLDVSVCDYLLKHFDSDYDKEAVMNAFENLPIDLPFLRQYSVDLLSKGFNFSEHIASRIITCIEKIVDLQRKTIIFSKVGSIFQTTVTKGKFLLKNNLLND